MLLKIDQALEAATKNPPRPAAASPATDPDTACRVLWDMALQVCPGYQVTDQLRPVLRSIALWAAGIPGDLDPAKGLLLWGENGTGKTTLAEIAANARLRLQRIPVYHQGVNATTISAAYQRESYEGVDPYIRWCSLCIDELGSEPIPTGYYSTTENVIQYLLQRRHDMRHDRERITYATTNYTPQQITELYGERIADRAVELFNFIPIRGESFRGKIKNQPPRYTVSPNQPPHPAPLAQGQNPTTP